MSQPHNAAEMPSSRRGRKPRARGEKTLALLQRALLAVIGRVGAAGITHRRVADEAGVSLSATTYYFQSKNDMVRQAYRFLCDGVRADADGLTADSGEPVRGDRATEEDAAAAGEYLRSRLRADASESLTLIELLLCVARDEEARLLLADDRAAIRQLMVELMAQSGSSNPEDDADLIAALINGLVLESMARGRPADFETRAVGIVSRVMKGIGSNEATSR